MTEEIPKTVPISLTFFVFFAAFGYAAKEVQWSADTGTFVEAQLGYVAAALAFFAAVFLIIAFGETIGLRSRYQRRDEDA